MTNINSYSVAERINITVNAQVQYKSDLEQYDKPELWVEANTFGDCEDYALLKRQLLLKSGFERKDLHLACCRCETGEYHCVLLCNTDNGWFVLDNRYAWPMPPKSLSYTWDKALDEVDGKWYKLSF
jgi:predicted transglutaminase-like cysteine proteinase